jgi:photosynthetic reaction center cytochrome c subunit
MKGKILVRLGAIVGLGLLLSSCDRPPIESIQRGFRGDGQVQMYNPRVYAAEFGEQDIPDSAPPADADGPRAKDVFQNVQVLGDLSSTQMVRVMVSMASWVTGGEGCSYCHVIENPELDVKYPKIVARRMLQMVRYINSHWKTHVGETGVTCYTCHRGNPVPKNLWFQNPASNPADSFGGWHIQQNSTMPSYVQANHLLPSAALGSLPVDPFTLYLKGSENIRVQATDALPQGNMGASIQQAEWTYSLMTIMAKSLGVNCNYCHNTQALAQWKESSPTRVTAWYGIRMVRSLNNNYEASIDSTLPASRHGPMGDNPNIYCATCHNGVFKPLYGISMLKDFPELKGDPDQVQDYLSWKAPMPPPKDYAPPAGDPLFIPLPAAAAPAVAPAAPVTAAAPSGTQ